MNYSVHATARMQQRAIPEFVVDYLQRFGSSMRAHGAERLFFDKAARARLRRYLGGERNLKMIERWLNVYVVVSDDGRLITAARQTERFWRRQIDPRLRRGTGSLKFINSPNIGYYANSVEVEGCLSLSLLQGRLKELNTGLQIETCNL